MPSDFERVVQALSDPGAYGHPVGRVAVRQTHISVVFLAGELAYKIKKPLDLGFLSYGTLEQRRLCCEEEVALNRRLCPALYLGVVPVTFGPAGIRVNGRGEILEYAVQMRRLPEDRMMDELLRSGGLKRAMVEALASHVADFHARCERGEEVARYGTAQAVRAAWEENFAQLIPFIGRTLTPFQDGLLRATATAWLSRRSELLERRREQGFVRDVHGDLRTSAVCFVHPIQVFDCLEFSARLRCSDVASEVAFMAMDLDLHGRPDLAKRFASAYVERSSDRELLQLLRFYQCYRACVRGKVESLRALEPEVGEASRAEADALARRCFALACRYATEERPPVLLVVSGLSGTGKSTLAAALARAEGWSTLASDAVRKELAHVPAAEHHPAPYGGGLYTETATRRTYEELASRAGQLLRAGRSVILDATFQKGWQRELALRAGEAAGALPLFAELVAPDAAVRERLLARGRTPGAISDAGWSTYLVQKRAWEPFEPSAWWHLQVRCDAPVDACLGRLRAQLSDRLEARGALP